MKKQKITILIIITGSLFAMGFSGSINPNFTPAFKIERSRELNEIIYEIGTNENGNLNVSEPIRVYWIKHTDGNKIEPLTWIQQNYAYGLRFFDVTENDAKFQFVSYKYRKFFVKRNRKGIFKVYTKSLNRIVEVRRIFIQFDGGTFWIPNISKVELYVKDILTGDQFVETIKPLTLLRRKQNE